MTAARSPAGSAGPGLGSRREEGWAEGRRLGLCLGLSDTPTGAAWATSYSWSEWL